ncbi:23S rRNA pseudouridine1911/1915/1917 synthase [Paenibacillus silagei]|uniref:RNA pseudouridylate synthase n=1 Tax=Paenibacillus silagei TaxID=1670801 RepID=A0ABS4NWK3_9BACL|nr:23S rRNA pseudouridine1911/1915/1917 synthase [Paenibacillus silagei]
MTAGPEELSGQHGGGETQDGSDGASGSFAGGGKWTRRGEWLEAMPGRVITAAADKQAAIDAWLLSVAGMPGKLHARLRRENGIQWRGDRLRLALFPHREAGIEPVWQEATAEVLFEDDFCLVVHKPAGLAVHPDGSSTEVTLDHLVAAHYAASGGGIAVRHIHRLDKDTTGPVLYAKNEYAQLVLDEDMREKNVSRLYAAIVEGIVPPELTVIDAPIGRDRHHAARRRVSPGGQEAVTRIVGREALPGGTVVKLQLETGRTHQIRVHLSHAGHPLFGDDLYGGSAWHTAGIPSGHSLKEKQPLRSEPGQVKSAITAWFEEQEKAGLSPGLQVQGKQPPAPPLKPGVKAKQESSDRQALHGEKLIFAHPWTRSKIEVSDPWPEDLRRLREQIGGVDQE